PPFTVSILIPARNEANVLNRIVTSIFASDYPASRLEVWVIDDGSQDQTPQRLEQLTTQFPHLKVLRRPKSSGGKSGALNAVFPQTTGEIIGVFDADAWLEPNVIRRAVLPFHQPEVGGVQLRKKLLNAGMNGLTQFQQWEQSFDAALQCQRSAAGAWVDLRGNGTFILRQSLQQCGGWNEDTLADDLDLTFQLYLARFKIVFLPDTSVYEEGTTNWRQFWQQRCRWAEGGYQRYIDYFAPLCQIRGYAAIDLWMFLILQFLLPLGLLADGAWSLTTEQLPVLWPLQTILGLILMVEMGRGLIKFESRRGWGLLNSTVGGLLYMGHWIPVMLVTVLKLCIVRQSLVWHRVEHGQMVGGGEN
ncbi:glycosyltransferase family 2 protein, partial [Synechocystis salina LEGE 00031]